AETPAATTPQATARIALERRTRPSIWPRPARPEATPALAPAPLRRAGAGRLAEEPALARVLLGGLHEAADHRADGVRLGVPLHAQHEAAVGQLERLDQVVGGGRGADEEPLADAVDALVVVGLGAV